MLSSKKQKLELGIQADVSEIKILRRAETPLFISDPFTAQKSAIPDDLWLEFYMKCKNNGVALGYPEGFLITKDNLTAGKTSVASRIVCHVGSAAYANGSMPAGDYLIACGYGGFADTEPIYRRLFQYIEENNVSVAGDAYEERLIDEIGSLEKDRQIIQVAIAVSI